MDIESLNLPRLASSEFERQTCGEQLRHEPSPRPVPTTMMDTQEQSSNETKVYSSIPDVSLVYDASNFATISNLSTVDPVSQCQ